MTAHGDRVEQAAQSPLKSRAMVNYSPRIIKSRSASKAATFAPRTAGGTF
jgi:hypothetical protein